MITILHLTWGLEVGGKEGFLNRIVRDMDSARFTHRIWTLRKTGTFFDLLKKDGYSVDFLDKRPGLDPGLSFRLRQRIRSLKPDLVHVHDFTSLLALSLVLMQADPPPLVATSHGGYLGLPAMKRNVCDLLLRRTATVVAVSQHLASVLGERLGKSVPVRHIPYDVDTSRFAAATASADLRRQLGVPDGSPIVLMVARLEPPKDQASLIRAAQHIRGRIPRCHFLFAGDGSRREALAALSADLGLGDCVHLPGTMQNVPGVVKIADVCVLSSFQEGLPRAVQEYMAAGKPVVASDVGGMRELLHDGEEGCLVGPGDSEALADRITFLLLHPEAAAIMGGKGRIAARERFASGTMCKAYEALYGEILEPTRAGAALS